MNKVLVICLLSILMNLIRDWHSFYFINIMIIISFLKKLKKISLNRCIVYNKLFYRDFNDIILTTEMILSIYTEDNFTFDIF